MRNIFSSLKIKDGRYGDAIHILSNELQKQMKASVNEEDKFCIRIKIMLLFNVYKLVA